jgi:predicted GIY-YIG superfamily endonuclease
MTKKCGINVKRNKKLIIQLSKKRNYIKKNKINENSGVYVLKLNNNKFYIGKSYNILNRIKSHNSNWVKAWGIVSQIKPLTPRLIDYESWERNETLERIFIHGFQNVRGWKYTQLELIDLNYKKDVFYEICEKKDLCRNCGEVGHFIKDCKNEKYSAFWIKHIIDF